MEKEEGCTSEKCVMQRHGGESNDNQVGRGQWKVGRCDTINGMRYERWIDQHARARNEHGLQRWEFERHAIYCTQEGARLW